MLLRLRSLRRFLLGAFQSRLPFEQRLRSGLCIFLLVIIFNLLIYNWYFGYVLDENYGRLAPESTIEENRNHVVHETICSKLFPDSCFSVVDVFDEKKNEVNRALLVKGFDSEYDTMVRLRKPNGLDFRNSDTRTWKIDHRAITSQYIAAMIAAPFMVGTLSLDNSMNVRKTMLNIGLGGGSLDMFFHIIAPGVNITVVELDPTMVELAQRWFGIVENAHRRTVVGDGIKVIEKTARENHTYDVIVVDACDLSHNLPCPAAGFRDENVIVNIKKLLTPMGCVVVNLLALESETMEKETDSVVELLKSHFPVCVKAWLPDELNIPVVCLPYALENSDISLLLYRKRFEMASAQFGLNVVLKNAIFREPAEESNKQRTMKCIDKECSRRFNGRKGKCKSFWSRVGHVMKFHSIHNYTCPIPRCVMKNTDVYEIGSHLKIMHPNAQTAHRRIYKNVLTRSKNIAIKKIDKYFPEVLPDGTLKHEPEDGDEEAVEPQPKRTSLEQPAPRITLEDLITSHSAPKRTGAVKRGRAAFDVTELSEDSEPENSSASTPSPEAPRSVPVASRTFAPVPIAVARSCSNAIASVKPAEEDDDIIVERHIVRSGQDPVAAVKDYVQRFGIPKAKVIDWRPPRDD
ncbi:hypothetical protein QR680_018968 [Steinernema hermaphroditum]|uniref:PABS domain-containing protein n=1 Tax=Steinernema hermaphroditum TaxID=289476 RepID=A0AA39HJK1_9BILA|nr:hypothetical protein QR680_018968 [Steinernema hermaphroditum]